MQERGFTYPERPTGHIAVIVGTGWDRKCSYTGKSFKTGRSVYTWVGIYKCEVSFGTLREIRRTNVKVRSGITELSTPKFNPQSPKKISALIGQSVMIPCHAGDRSPDTSLTEIRWEKDDKRLGKKLPQSFPAILIALQTGKFILFPKTL